MEQIPVQVYAWITGILEPQSQGGAEGPEKQCAGIACIGAVILSVADKQPRAVVWPGRQICVCPTDLQSDVSQRSSIHAHRGGQSYYCRSRAVVMTMQLLCAMSAITLYCHQFLNPGGPQTEFFYPSFARN